MILIDYNGLVISHALANYDKSNFSVDLIRHQVLDRIRTFKKKFPGFGRIIICCDAQESWRKEIFPYYKIKRKKNREKSKYDWTIIHAILNQLRSEFTEYLPYPVVCVNRCEADDLISTYCRPPVYERDSSYSDLKKMIIVSADNDFLQLTSNINVLQWSSKTKQLLTVENADLYREIHIITGDRSDSIPNALTEDDVYAIEGKRQRSLTETRAKQIYEAREHKRLPYYERNRKLIDLTALPEDIEKLAKDGLWTALQNMPKKEKLQEYLAKNNMMMLMTKLHEF
jgi:5'-3' exonuclease